MPGLSHTTLAILVGGAGRRMGMPKARLTIDGEQILSRLHRTLDWPGPTMLVTVRERQHPPACELFDREVVDPSEQGPLIGVRTALHHTETDLTIVLPVDMIEMTRERLSWFVAQLEQRVATVSAIMSQRRCDGEQRIEPLPLTCGRRLAGIVDQQIEQGDRSLRGLLRSPAVLAVQSPAEWGDGTWANLNSPEDLARNYAR